MCVAKYMPTVRMKERSMSLELLQKSDSRRKTQRDALVWIYFCLFVCLKFACFCSL